MKNINKWSNYNKIEKFVKNELFFNYNNQIKYHQTLTPEDFKQEILLKIFTKTNEKYLIPIHYGYLRTIIKNELYDKYNIYQFIKKGKNSKKPPQELTYKEFNENIYTNGIINHKYELESYFGNSISKQEIKILRNHSRGIKTIESNKLIRKLKRINNETIINKL